MNNIYYQTKYIITLIFTFYLYLFCETSVFCQQNNFNYGSVYDAAFSHDGTKIATATSRGLQIWNADPFELIDEYSQENGFHILKWSPNDTKIFAGQEWNLVTDINIFIVYSIEQKEAIIELDKSLTWPRYPNKPSGIKPFTHNNVVNYSNDDSYIAIIQSDKVVNIYELNSGNITFNKSFNDGESPYAVEFSKEANIIWVGLSTNKIQFINILNNDIVSEIQLERKPEGVSGLTTSTFNVFEITNDFKYVFSFINRVPTRIGISYQVITSFYKIESQLYCSNINNSLYVTTNSSGYGYPSRFYYKPESEVLLLFDEEPIRQFDLKTGKESEIEGFKPIEFTSYFPQPFSPNGTIVLSDDYKAFVELPLGDSTLLIENTAPKGPDLFKNNLITGEKIRLLPLPSTVKDYETYE